MKAADPTRPDRTYAVRAQVNLSVSQALAIEQGARQRANGQRAKLADIAADWLEEKAQAVLKSYFAR